MAGPWFFESLGLPAHADGVAVRRAYAVALREIDPANDPEAFVRLRDAYVAARAWCEESADATAGARPEPVASGSDTSTDEASGATPPSGTAATFPADYTETLIRRFAIEVDARGGDAIPRLLDENLIELRMQYIDAPGQFEEHLIDLIGNQRVGHREKIFSAAETCFHWNEVGHLPALGPRGRWVELALAQRGAWEQALDAGQRKRWLGILARANDRLDVTSLLQWPSVAKLHERYPAWIGLHVSDETLRAWQEAFDARRQAARDPSGAASSDLPEPLARVRRKLRLPPISRIARVFLFSLLVGGGYFVLHGMRRPSSSPMFSPYAEYEADTPRQCVELYVQMDKQDALDALSREEAEAIETRARHCAKAGHWHPPMRTR